MTIYIIEHLEPKIFPWCLLEYQRISEIVGKDNLWFTNIKSRNKKLAKLGKIFKQPVSKLKLERICILDPESKQTLTSKDKNKFKYFIFGGILGDYPPRKRTKIELTSKFSKVTTRNIGKAQLSTDNAVYVTNKIIKGGKLEKTKFVDSPEIKINKIESIILPYSYPIKDNKPMMSPKLVKYLKNKKSF